MNRLFSGRSDMPFALLLLAPSLLLLGGLVAWPMVSNIEISFLRLPLNPNIESTFVGVSNYVRILSDPGFWHSLWMTVWYTALVVAGSTVLGLAVAMFFNREFRLRKTARSLVILSYVTPSISLVFAWKYMFNNGYGIVNGTVAKLAMRQPFVLFKGLTFQKLCLPGAFRPGDHHNKMLRPGLCVVHASPQYL
uniref:carbohydrate ABC transporter permease n=4 Tax=Escherichia coli TaxID=562 RepID=UPI0035C0B39A